MEQSPLPNIFAKFVPEYDITNVASSKLQTFEHIQDTGVEVGKKRASDISSSTPSAEIPNDKPHHLVIHQSIMDRLNQFIECNKIPHIIFHGPSGSGKLTLVKEFIQKIYGSDRAKIKVNVMTVNCSHGKGIQFIREELKFFAKTNMQAKDGTEFKTILLLNAHHLTVDAQSALRRCIELFSYNTRFFIVVENKNKLLNPILSRFCDIYVPEHIDENGQTVNLHKYVLSTQFKFHQTHFAEIDRFLNEKKIGEFDIKDMMETVHSMYECGISCLDLMEWVEKKKEQWSVVDYSRAVMRFHKVKLHFRCEKLLMLHMINFLYEGEYSGGEY